MPDSTELYYVLLKAKTHIVMAAHRVGEDLIGMLKREAEGEINAL